MMFSNRHDPGDSRYEERRGSKGNDNRIFVDKKKEDLFNEVLDKEIFSIRIELDKKNLEIDKKSAIIEGLNRKLRDRDSELKRLE